MVALHAQNAVGSEIEGKKQSAAMPVLRNVSNPTTFALSRIDPLEGLAFQQDLTRCCFAQTGENLYQLSLPVAFNAGDAERLAAAHFERNAVENRFAFRALKREPSHAQHRLLGPRFIFLHPKQYFTSDHHSREPLGRGFASRRVPDYAPVAHHRDVVR